MQEENADITLFTTQVAASRSRAVNDVTNSGINHQCPARITRNFLLTQNS